MEAELERGDRVVLQLPGSTAYVEVVLGLLAAGVFPVPLDPSLTTAEREPILADVDPRLVVTEAARLAELRDAFAIGLPRGRPMHVTSGTTGRPKAVHSGILDESAARALVEEERELWGFADDDVNLVLSPIHHSAPLRFAMGTLLAGGRLAFPERQSAGGVDPLRVTELIEAERPTSMFCVPTHLQRLFAHWDEVGTPDLRSFRLVAHAGAPCPPELKHRLMEEFPDGSTWEFYGSTEGQFTACRSEEWLDHPGTVGRARPGRELRVDDDGILWCKVPGHARFDYFRDPEKTAAAWRGDWFTVRDLGRIDDTGHVYLDGRRVDLVISGGVNVYPAEVENALREHPGVQDVAVYGMPDERWGQRVCAAVVGPAAEAELAAYARERLSPAKRPKQWLFLDALPRTATGKVRRGELRKA